jgi:hypothetical protein
LYRVSVAAGVAVALPLADLKVPGGAVLVINAVAAAATTTATVNVKYMENDGRINVR